LSWKRPFDDPIPLPRGRQLVTLRDAALYITKLPKAEHDTDDWQAAMLASLDPGCDGWRLFRLAPERRGRIVAAMDFLDNALTLITLLSLFLLGPAIGRALVARFDNWQHWSLPIQHLAVGICTMIAVTGMVLVYGALWKLSPKSVAWYSWIQEVPVAGNVNVTRDGQRPAALESFENKRLRR